MSNELLHMNQDSIELEKKRVELENQNKRIVAITHIHELATKDKKIHDELLIFYKEILDYADRNNISYSVIKTEMDLENTDKVI
jgi:hypothetical protein